MATAIQPYSKSKVNENTKKQCPNTCETTGFESNLPSTVFFNGSIFCFKCMCIIVQYLFKTYSTAKKKPQQNIPNFKSNSNTVV